MMYKIITTSGTELGLVDSVRFIKISPEGALVEASKDEAVGIAFNSSPYNLAGKNEIKGAESVLIIDVDAGKELSDLRDITARQSEELRQTDETAIALYESITQQNDVIAQQDEALLYLYEHIGG